mmetsp:Transcript_26772/g.61347  ORF Transcript_26772/g.61347 Transcript_26772/m.61347 type:complete len:207 (-) Transcript_26772:52-672(-)
MLEHDEYVETRTGQGCLLPHSSLPYINTGVWGVRPNIKLYREIMGYLEAGLARCYDGDQSVAQDFLGRRHPSSAVQQLHTGYNLKANQAPLACLQSRNLTENDAYAIVQSGVIGTCWPGSTDLRWWGKHTSSLCARGPLATRRFIVHWSGNQKPIIAPGDHNSYKGSARNDTIEARARALYMAQYNKWWAKVDVRGLGDTVEGMRL